MTDNGRIVKLWARMLASDRVSVTENHWPSRSFPVQAGDINVAAEVSRAAEPSYDETWFEITLADYSDHHGSDLDAANIITLRETFVDVVTELLHIGGERAYVVLGSITDPVELESLVESIEGLDENPILSEQDHQEYIMVLAHQAWDQWLRLDFPHDAEDEFTADPDDRYAQLEASCEFFDDNEEALREAYYECPDNYWYAESATSVVNSNHHGAVEYAVRMVRGY